MTEDIQIIIDTLKNIDSKAKADEYMESNGFKRIGRGCESHVYSNDDIDYVIKYQYSPFNHSGSLIDSTPSEEHFAKQTVYRGRYNVIVQEKCAPINTLRGHYKSLGKDVYQEYINFRKWIEETFKVGDVHCDNVGIRNGKFVVIDWITWD